MKTLINILLLSLMFISLTLNAQTQIRCSTNEHEEVLNQSNIDYNKHKLNLEKKVNEYLTKSNSYKQQQGITTIPVVVHVLWNKAHENASDAKIQTQLDVLNKDFTRTNDDTANTPAPFKALAGNVGFQFCLATIDPQGNATTGIERRYTDTTKFGLNNNIKFFSKGGLDAWDPTKYFNIWIGNLATPNQILFGYAEFPGDTISRTFGVVLNVTTTGTVDTLLANYGKGRTATHEIAHCFGMYHIWGAGVFNNCVDSDSISDTPNQRYYTLGAPTFPKTDVCSNSFPGIMFMNYMDYCYDASMNLFTIKQAQKMNAVFAVSPYSSLATSTVCQLPSSVSNIAHKDEIAVYPNPAQHNLTIDFSVNETKQIELINILGETVYSNTNSGNSIQIATSDLKRGLYLLKIANSKGDITVKKIILN